MQHNHGLYAGQGTDLNQEERAIVADAFPTVVEAFAPIMAEKHAPGLALGVVINGELAHLHATGSANLEAKHPVRPDTAFRIASMTKSFAALAILQLRDAGRLELDTPVAEVVPELAAIAYPAADSPLVTVRHLLTMTAGLPQDDPWADRQLYRDDDWLCDFLRRGLQWSNAPGIRFEYSNLSYMILGRVIANVAGQRAMAYVSAHILAPLGMRDTVWNAGDVPDDRLARGYAWLDDAHHPLELLPCNNDGAVFAGLYTTVADLARWVTLLADAWRPDAGDESPIARRSTLREMQQIWSSIPPALDRAQLGVCPPAALRGYGFGLSITAGTDRRAIGHGGGLPGFGSHMRWSREHRLGIIAFANVTYAGVSGICGEVLDSLIDTVRNAASPRRQFPNTPALAAARRGINALLDKWDDELADRIFADSFFLDLDRDHWRARLADLHQRHGALEEDGTLQAENRLRGEWRMRGERGRCTIWLSLAPTHPPAIQALEITSVLPPTAAMHSTLAGLAELVSHPTLGALDRLRSSASDRDALWHRVNLAHWHLGSCEIGELLAGDGARSVRVSLQGADGELEVRLTCDQHARLLDVQFHMPG